MTRTPYRRWAACAAWWLALALWSYGLLSPEPPRVGAAVLPSPWAYYVSKALHLSAFAGLALSACLLPATRRHRRLLVAVLAAHAGLTEYLQTFVEGRYGCLADVGLNLTGVTLGALLARGWRLGRRALRRAGQGRP